MKFAAEVLWLTLIGSAGYVIGGVIFSLFAGAVTAPLFPSFGLIAVFMCLSVTLVTFFPDGNGVFEDYIWPMISGDTKEG